MEAHGMFFAGQVEVEALLNSTGFAGRAKRGSDSGDGGADAGGAGPSMGAGGGRGGGRRRGGESATAGSGSDAGAAPQIRPSNLPAVALHLRLTNHGPALVDVEVIDFNSDLGDFVVEPPKISLPPNAQAEADPMISRLGVSSDEIPLTVSLRIDGSIEKQVLMLKVIKPSAPPGPAANPPS
jgi:hypothetical protein